MYKDKLKTGWIAVFILMLFFATGCGQQAVQSELPAELQKREYLSDADYVAAQSLLTDVNAIEAWHNLAPETQRAVWPTLVRSVDYPAGSVSLLQVLEVDLHADNVPSEIAWVPLPTTVINPSGVESAVVPTLPETVNNFVEAEGNIGALAAEAGVDVTAVYNIPQLAQQPVPATTGQIIYAPVTVYESITRADMGTAYQYNRLLILVFQIESE